MKGRKFLSLLMAMVMVMSMTFTASAAEAAEGQNLLISQKPAGEKIVLLHTNDVHGAIEHYAQVAALKQQYAAEGAYVLLLDAGDFIQGDPVVNTNQGAVAIELMNLSHYDAVALGNHEFDYGYENIKKLVEGAQYPVLAANVLYNGQKTFGDRVVFTSPAGTKIGVFGVDTPETATKAHPGKIKGITFLGQDKAEDMFRNAQEQVDALKAEGCDIVVCLAHLGTDNESIGHRSIDLLNAVNGIDVLIDGHSHSTLEEVREATGGSGMVNGAYVTSTGTKLKSIGKVVIEDKKVTEVTGIDTETLAIAPDPVVMARAEEIRKNINDEYDTVFATTEIELNGVKANVRSGETNLGDLIADAMLWGVRKNGIDADAVVTNGGGIRATINAGNVTKKDVNTVLPFGNELCVVKITGAELLEALEASTFCTPDPIGGFPQVAGIEYNIDSSKAYDAGDNYPGSTYHRPAHISRVSIRSVAGKPFDPAKVYSVVTNDFLASGGDTYYVFKSATSNINLGYALDEIVMDYIVSELGGKITAAAYGAPQSRITVGESAAVQPAAGYVVEANDSLWKIAKKVYGNGEKWIVIYRANKGVIRNPEVIYKGQPLVIPAA